MIETTPRRGFPGSSFKYTPLRHIRVLFTAFAQSLFKEAPPGAYRWSQDLDTTEIIISSENVLNPEVLGVRPGITFTRGPVQFHTLGFDDMEFYDFATGRKTKNVLVPGTMSINCCSRVDLESEDIAWVLTEHMWLLREILLKEGFFDIASRPMIGSPSPAGSIIAGDQGEEWYATTVTVPFQISRQSAFTPLGKKIVKSIELGVQTAAYSVPTGGPALQSHEYPIYEHACPPESYAPLASDTNGRTPDPAGTRQTFLPKQPHPLNPAITVTTRTVTPFAPGIKPPSINGRQLPIKDPCKGESGV